MFGHRPSLMKGIATFLPVSAMFWLATLQVRAPGQEAMGDHWDSESMHLRIAARLHEMQTLIRARDTAPSSWEASGLLAHDIKATALVPSVWKRRYDSASWEISEGRPPPEFAHAGVAGWVAALRMLTAEFPDANAPIQSEFKVVGIALSAGGRVETEVLAAFSALAESAPSVEMHVPWSVTWQVEGGDAPRLQTLRAGVLEKSILKSGRTVFADATGTLAVSAPSISDQLGFGNEYWRSRIEHHHIIDKFGHNGLAIGDIDGDGLDDVYICQPGGLPNRLYRHLPDGSVEDVSAASGTDLLDNTRSALFVDWDNDGDQDLVAATASGVVLMENNGTGAFRPRDVIRAVFDAYSLAAADYDGDGDLDLYACRYHVATKDTHRLPIPVPYNDANNGGRNYLIRNDGDWKTADVTAESGLDVRNQRFSYAVVWFDCDGDGDQDLYVVNDFGKNNLYRNEGGRFAEVTAEAGLEVGAFGMSASVGDYDGDGREDLYVGNMFSSAGNRVTTQARFKPELSAGDKAAFRHLARGNTLFLNRGPTFEDATARAGVAMGRWSWGSVFADVNNDGWEDFLVTNGYVTGRDPDDL